METGYSRGAMADRDSPGKLAGGTTLTQAQIEALLHLADRIIPEDRDPSATQAGFASFLARSWGDFGEDVHALLARGLNSLRAEAEHRHSGRGFTALSEAEADALVRAIERGEVETDWSTYALLFLHQVIALVTQSYYGDPENGGNRDGRSWDRIGFRPGPKRPFVEPNLPPLQVTGPRDLDRHYEAVVVGAGAGGGIVACMLAEAGRRVLLLERGEALTNPQVSRDHLRNHRLALYGHNTGPPLEGHPRVLEAHGEAQIMRPFELGYHNNAMTVGGGTRVYAGQAWRFAPQDFRMATIYGVPEGSSLADWPLDYETLAPFYELAENEIGVSGELGHSHAGPRSDYPMPPVDSDLDGPVLKAAARKLGWNVRGVPLAINTVPRHGRPACVAFGTCVGFACPSEARGGTANTMIPRALATGNCQLVTGAQASRIEVDERGRARAVEFFHAARGEPGKTRIEADLVVVAAGAVETARLLLLSRDARHPDGLGNRFDQVGRHFQGHIYCGAFGLHPETIRTSIGPGNALATCDFNHGTPGVIGGGLLANESPFPLYLSMFFWPELPRWGPDSKDAMAKAYQHTLIVMGPIQEVPNPEARVVLDPQVRDRWGLPVVRLRGHMHPACLEPARMLRGRAEEWLQASGVERAHSFIAANPKGLTGGQHQAGTCRMGNDPRRSVTDVSGRVHGHENLYIADASLHVTNGGFNPMLTVMANAFRVSAAILYAS
jgi:choline dehydrogenase-like flavoprotein